MPGLSTLLYTVLHYATKGTDSVMELNLAPLVVECGINPETHLFFSFYL